MAWLYPTMGEVGHFHPEFEAAANESLLKAGLDADYEWVHHLRTPNNSVVPDFVLRQKSTQKWLLAFEIKRTKEAVFSTRYQIQAKGYAEQNQHLYVNNAPRYFVISNLEVTILFALRGQRPPIECRIQNGLFESGEFVPGTAVTHRAQFIHDLISITQFVISTTSPQFDVVWPTVLSEFKHYAEASIVDPSIRIQSPVSRNWDLVRDYFGSDLDQDSIRMFFLRCLMAEYLRGLLLKHGHPRASSIPAIQNQPTNRIHTSVATALDQLRTVDFDAMFENFASGYYRNLTDRNLKNQLKLYVEAITKPPRVVDLAVTRVDSYELLDSLLDAVYPLPVRDDSGKVPTDIELANILATFSVSQPGISVVDPCCGDGALIAASYDRLQTLGMTYDDILRGIYGVEADALSTRIAYLRIALKEPVLLSPSKVVNVVQGDMFAHANTIGNCDVVLMNPPFKRYEAQDTRPVPPALRTYYETQIQSIDNLPATTVGSQANLFNFYVEFAVKAAKLGATVGIILDNKWYHNKYGTSLRELILKQCEVEAIIEYPHGVFFSGWTIATSILIVKKVTTRTHGHTVKFIRCKVDPRGSDLAAIDNAFRRGASWPTDWTCREVEQNKLDAKNGWKTYFANDLKNDFRTGLPTLPGLFKHSRRGSLNKEEGGVGTYEYPLERNDYGPQRLPLGTKGRSFQTKKGRKLTDLENQSILHLSRQIPENYLGWSLRNADDAEGFVLNESAVIKQRTIEPPTLRNKRFFHGKKRSPWTYHHEMAVRDMKLHEDVEPYISAVESIVNLNETVLPRENLWVGLREPYAGELIIPRKTRAGHRVHINPFAFDPSKRQVRISSNFITFKNCIARDHSTRLDRKTAVYLIAAFLVSSFGQLQFEMEGYNREGLLCVEDVQLGRISVFDPRWVRPDKRQAIIDAFQKLPYPVSTTQLSSTQYGRNVLDDLFADEICERNKSLNKEELLNEVHSLLDEWITGRNP